MMNTTWWSETPNSGSNSTKNNSSVSSESKCHFSTLERIEFMISWTNNQKLLKWRKWKCTKLSLIEWRTVFLNFLPLFYPYGWMLMALNFLWYSLFDFPYTYTIANFLLWKDGQIKIYWHLHFYTQKDWPKKCPVLQPRAINSRSGIFNCG